MSFSGLRIGRAAKGFDHHVPRGHPVHADAAPLGAPRLLAAPQDDHEGGAGQAPEQGEPQGAAQHEEGE